MIIRGDAKNVTATRFPCDSQNVEAAGWLRTREGSREEGSSARATIPQWDSSAIGIELAVSWWLR